jgi:hypothetical protein
LTSGGYGLNIVNGAMLLLLSAAGAGGGVGGGVAARTVRSTLATNPLTSSAV